jgi:hypothetical protein
LTLADECESKIPKRTCVIRPNCQHAAQLVYGLVVAAGAEQNPPDGIAGIPKRVQVTGPPGPSQSLLRTPLAQQPASESEVRSRVARVQFQGRCRYSAFGLAPLPLLLQRICQQDVRFGKLRIEF